MRRVKKGKSLKDNREIPNITICRDRFPITVAIIEQPVLCPQRLNLLHREGWSPAHSPVVCPYTFYIIAVAVAIGRELTHPTNVANLHAVVVQTCGNHHFRMCRVSFLHVAVQQSQGTVGIAAYRIEAFHTFLQSISTVIAPVPPWPILIAFTILFYMAAQEAVIVVVQINFHLRCQRVTSRY